MFIVQYPYFLTLTIVSDFLTTWNIFYLLKFNGLFFGYLGGVTEGYTVKDFPFCLCIRELCIHHPTGHLLVASVATKTILLRDGGAVMCPFSPFVSNSGIGWKWYLMGGQLPCCGEKAHLYYHRYFPLLQKNLSLNGKSLITYQWQLSPRWSHHVLIA